MSGLDRPRRHVILGGTSGMGLAAARILATQGASVALLGMDMEKATAKASALAAETGAKVIGDGLADGGAGAAVERVIARLGGVDGLAVTAGPVQTSGNMLELTDSDWSESFDTQVMTVVRAIRAALPHMIAGGGGSIVTVSALSIRLSKPFLPHYGAMKAAIAALTKNIARTYGAQGIRANCIAPGAFATEQLNATRDEATALYPALSPDDALNRYAREQWKMDTSLGRLGRPNEAGDLIAFLLSESASYITGALVNIDGGSDF
jgi:3-oxoacyl-[acyl-carrier protein] reductase